MISTPALNKKLIDILTKLNDIIGNYPIYLYYIDDDYHLLWWNNFISKSFPAVNQGDALKCYNALWGYTKLCDDCPSVMNFNGIKTSRNKLKRKHPISGNELYLEMISLPVRSPSGELEGVLKLGIDITAQENEQNLLREKEILYSSIVSSSADAIFLLDRKDRITSWNKGAEDIFGYPADEVVGKSNVVLIPQALIELGEQYYIDQEVEKKGFIRKYETQRIHKSGKIIYVDLTRTLIRNEQGESMGSSVMIKDITSRKELEFELRRTILELSKLNELHEISYTTYILDDILKMILVAVTAGEGLRFNRAFLLLINKETDSLEGYLAVGPLDQAEAQRIWSSIPDHFLSLKEVMKQFSTKIGQDHRGINEIVRSIKVPLSNNNNILIKTLENRKEIMVRNGEAPVDIDLNFNGDNLIDHLGTNSFITVPLVTKNETIGVIIADNKITGRDITAEEIQSLKLFANQASLAIENAQLYKNLEDHIQKLKTAYKTLEEKSGLLVKKERLAAIGEMSAKIAHEIRNPLVSIGGFARLLERKAPDNPDIKKYTSIISSQVNNLESILNNILTIAKPLKKQHKGVDIHNIIHQVLMMLDDLIQRHHVKVILSFQCKESTVLGDEKLLYQVLLNLIKNSLEAMSEELEITIRTKIEGDYIQVQVMDTGVGISSDHLYHIYDPFFTTKKEGTGLGLSVVRQIISDHQGEIDIKSEFGEGTTINFKLPRYIRKRNHENEFA